MTKSKRVLRYLSGALVLLAASFMYGAVKQADQYSGDGLSFSYPSGWTVVDESDAQTQTVKVDPGRDGLKIIIVALRRQMNTVELAEAQPKFTQAIVDTLAQTLARLGAQIQRVSVSYPIGGVQAPGIKLRASLQGDTGEADIYWLVMGGRLVHVVYLGSDRERAGATNAWNTICSTLRVGTPTVAPPTQSAAPSNLTGYTYRQIVDKRLYMAEWGRKYAHAQNDDARVRIADYSGQKSHPAAPAQVSDALVFGNREWIYYLAPNSSTPRKLAQGNFPALSPDRKRVVYCAPVNAGTSASGALMIFDLASGRTVTLFRSNAWFAHPRWSPQGDTISFTQALSSGKRQLDLITPDGTEPKRLIAGGEQGIDDVFNPVWAPDGQSLYFQDMSSLVQVSTTGETLSKTPLRAIVEEKEAVTSADSFVPSPKDANLIAYTRSVPGTRLFERTFGEPNTALFLYDMRTKTRRRLTAVDLLAMDPVWSRDGRFIYFAGYQDREGRAAYPFKIYRIASDGTSVTQVAVGETPDT